MFAVKLANFLMFTVSGENTVKCLEEKPIVFNIANSYLLFENRFKNFEPVLKGAVVSLFDPCQQYSGKPGDQSRTKSPRCVDQRQGQSRNIMEATERKNR